MNIRITYNSYTYKIEIETDDKSFNNEECGKQCKQIIKENEKNRIEVWFESFLIKFGEDFNHPDLNIAFTSVQYECNKIEEIVSKTILNKSWNVSLELINIEDKNVLGELHELINSIVKEKEDILYGQLQDKQVFSQIEDIEKGEVSIVVIAPMSAGKSTLINALIGSDLLPSQNKATTATICKIKDIDGKEGFDAVIKNGKGEILESQEDIDAAYIEDYNDKGNNEDIEIFIEGDIKNINSSDLKLVLVDTPGPNNSQNSRHQEVTLNYIKDKNNNPLILYILNATQLRTNDDKTVLREISEFIKQNGSKAKERIVFVLNKIDELDPEKNPKSETLEKVIEDCKSYLVNDFEIESPKIFPISAQFAKLTLKEESILGRKEKADLINFKNTILPDSDSNYEGVDTIKFAAILEKQKKVLYRESAHDLYKASLHYSGLTALQIYINDYVNNTHKIKIANGLINAIKPALDNVVIEHKKAYLSSEEEIKKCSEDLEKITPFLSEEFGEEKKRLGDKINSIPNDNKELNNLQESTKKKFDKILFQLSGRQVKKHEAVILLEEAKKTANVIGIVISTTIKSENEKSFKDVKDEIQNMIELTFKQLVTDAKLSDQNTDMLKNHIQININSTVDKSIFIKKDIEKKIVSDSSWYNPFSWGKTKTIDVFVNVEYVNLKDIYNLEFSPKISLVLNEIENVRVSFAKSIKKMKSEGISKIEEIENILKGKIVQEQNIRTQIELSGSVKAEKQKDLEKMVTYQEEIEKIIK
jgi:GTPase Era involved in 16S rRNA processing